MTLFSYFDFRFGILKLASDPLGFVQSGRIGGKNEDIQATKNDKVRLII